MKGEIEWQYASIYIEKLGRHIYPVHFIYFPTYLHMSKQHCPSPIYLTHFAEHVGKPIISHSSMFHNST